MPKEGRVPNFEERARATWETCASSRGARMPEKRLKGAWVGMEGDSRRLEDDAWTWGTDGLTNMSKKSRVASCDAWGMIEAIAFATRRSWKPPPRFYETCVNTFCRITSSRERNQTTWLVVLQQNKYRDQKHLNTYMVRTIHEREMFRRGTTTSSRNNLTWLNATENT